LSTTHPKNGAGSGARDAWERLGTWGTLALGAMVLALVFVGVTGWALVRDAAMLRPESVAPAEAEVQEGYESAMEERLAQVRGRSMFFVPPAPAEVAEEVEETPEDEGPAPKPTRYAGPDIVAVVNGAVWFANERRVAVGEEGGGVRVVSVDGSPWSVRLEWRGEEFDVQVFERTTDRFLTKEDGGT